MENRPVRVYLSMSKQVDPVVYKEVESSLLRDGFEVYRYEGGKYSTDKLQSCDVVLFLTHSGDNFYEDLSEGRKDSEHYVGKGQYKEAEFTYDNGILGIVYLSMKEEGVISMSLLDGYDTSDTTDWQNEYGIIQSYRYGNPNFNDFVTGKLINEGVVNHTPKNTVRKRIRNKLLLLVNNFK